MPLAALRTLLSVADAEPPDASQLEVVLWVAQPADAKGFTLFALIRKMFPNRHCDLFDPARL